MADNAVWANRISEWKSSGLTSVEYCKGKPFTAGGLRHMAFRLGRKGAKADKPTVRLARVVVRKSAETPSPKRQRPSSEAARQEGAPGAEAVVMEVGFVRVAVRPGFDRETLAAVLDVLGARGGAR